MRKKNSTKEFYKNQLKFSEIAYYGDYLILEKDTIEIHFFLYESLNPKGNYGQVYIRTENIKHIYQELLDDKVEFHPTGKLETKSWQQKEFSL